MRKNSFSENLPQKHKHLLRWLFLILFFIFFLTVKSQSVSEELATNDYQELTIFVIRSASPLNWDSPEKLYKSYRKSLLTNFTKRERTIKGHLFIRLKSPLLAEPLYAGVVAANKKEEKKNFFIDKIGLSVFGTTMKGTVHGTKVTLRKIKIHKKNEDIAYLKIRLSPSATNQIIRYYKSFTNETAEGFKPVDNYGGAFWPLYENEGSGCSAFAIALLDLIEVHEFEKDLWLKTVYIPMNLIGGEINEFKKIKVSSIRKTKKWAESNGKENVDYVKFSIYDPTTVFNWILNRHQNEQLNPQEVIAEWESDIPGLFIDKSKIDFDTTAPILRTRPDHNFFVDFHLKKLEKQSQNQHSTNY